VILKRKLVNNFLGFRSEFLGFRSEFLGFRSEFLGFRFFMSLIFNKKTMFNFGEHKNIRT